MSYVNLISWLFPTTESPRFIRGTSTLLGLAVAMAALICINSMYLIYMNRKKSSHISQGQDNEVLGEGDLRLDFKYIW